MALPITGWRFLFLADLWLAGAAGLPVIYHDHMEIFVDNLLAEKIIDPTRILTERFCLTPLGQKYARFLFEEVITNGTN